MDLATTPQSVDDFLEAAQRFLKLYESTPAEYPEGRVIFAFYRALHLVQAVSLHKLGKVPVTHTDRANLIRNQFRSMWKHYRPLLEESERARYLKGGYLELSAEQVEYQLRRRRLGAIEKWAEKELGRPITTAKAVVTKTSEITREPSVE